MESLLAWNVTGHAHLVTEPLIVIHGTADVLPPRFARWQVHDQAASSNKRPHWIDTHNHVELVELYDQDPYVGSALSVAMPFLIEHLGRPTKRGGRMAETNAEYSQIARRLAAQDALTRVFVQTDRRDWESVRASLTDTVSVDHTSLNGGEPLTAIAADDLVASWPQGLTGFEPTQHLLGSFIVDEVTPERVKPRFYAIATHVPHAGHGDPTWTVAGLYDPELRHTGAGVKLASLTLRTDWVTGSIWPFWRDRPVTAREPSPDSIALATRGARGFTLRTSLISTAIRALAGITPTVASILSLIDSTSVPCGASRETAKRSDLAGHAGYGYCASDSRYFWVHQPALTAELDSCIHMIATAARDLGSLATPNPISRPRCPRAPARPPSVGALRGQPLLASAVIANAERVRVVWKLDVAITQPALWVEGYRVGLADHVDPVRWLCGGQVRGGRPRAGRTGRPDR